MFDNQFGTYNNVECGLVCIIYPPENTYVLPKTFPVPLRSVSIQASIIHAVAQVEITQVYVNKEDQPIEAIYYFPVDSNGGVTHFSAELEGKTIKGIVKPEEEAKNQYEKAIQEKKSVFLVESNKPDIFKVRIGYLKPGSQVKIVIGYVTEVKNEKGSNALRFFIPTTVSPRYTPEATTDEKALDLKNMTFSTNSPAPLSINVSIALQGEIKKIESPSHKINIISKSSVPGKKSWTSATVTLEGRTTDMDRDFVLNVVPQEVHIPKLYQEKTDESTVIMAHLIPSFNLDEQKVELIFVLDRSGSMQGQSITLAKKALQLFLHSLPVDCYFNVIGFGSSFQFLFPESVKYDDGTFKKALLFAESLDADLGGTEILQPLKEVFSRKSVKGYLRQIFIITDGEVSNTEQVIGFVKANAHSSRVFTLGIGDGASHDLVEGVATAGGGTAAFASYNEIIDSKVLQQLKNAIQPSLTDISISWDGRIQCQSGSPVEINQEKTLLGYRKPINSGLTPENTTLRTFIQVPERIPPIFDGSQLLVFGIFNAELPSEICIIAESPDGPLSIKIQRDSTGEHDVGSTEMLHKLAAIKTINELQLKMAGINFSQDSASEGSEIQALRSQIVDISCRNNIVSKFTSFVAVDSKSSQASEENWVMQTRYVPSQYTHGWHGGYSIGAASNFYCSPSLSCGSAPRARARARRSTKSSSSDICADAFDGGSALRKSAKLTVLGMGLCSSVVDGSTDEEEEEFEEYKPSTIKGEAILTESDRLHKIVRTQSFDGSFSLNEKFSDALQLNLDTLKNNAKTNGWAENVYATALALSYFCEKFQDLKESWELVALKATKWLQKNAGTHLDSITSAATAFIRSV